MRVARAPEPVFWLLGALAIAVLGVLETTLAYQLSPLAALAAPIGLAVAVVVLHRPQVGICAGFLSVPLEVLHASGGSFQLTPLKVMLVLSAAGILLRVLRGLDRLTVDPLLVAYGAGLLWMATGFANAPDTTTVMKMLTMWTAIGIVALYVSNGTPRHVRQVLWSIVIGAAATAMIAIATGSTQEAVYNGAEVTNRATGSFTHPNQLAFFLVLSLPAGLVLGVREQRPALRLLAGGAVVAMFVALMLTLTRGAIIGAAFSLAAMLVWAPFRRLAATALVALAAFAAFNADAISHSKEVSLVGARLATVLHSDQANVNNERLRIWGTVPRIVSDHPVFGLGLGNFQQYSIQYGLVEGGLPFEHAHNVALTVLSEQGIPGLLLFLLAVFLAARKALIALGRKTRPMFPYALAVIAGLTGLFVNGLTDYPPGSNPNMTLIVVELGILIAVTRHLVTGESLPEAGPANA